MKLLIGIPTLVRSDLLVRMKEFLETVETPDHVIILDNGGQKIDIDVPIERTKSNLGVSKSWNLLMRRAFVDGDFDGLVLLQDDIIWDHPRLEAARSLLAEKTDVDLFLSYHQFSIQIHRYENPWRIGFYDERFSPAYCEDDDYALTMQSKGRIYERFHELDPLPGSIMDGTPKGVSWQNQHRRLREKWGDLAVGINDPTNPRYRTSRR